tara:strand:+ start:4818 stop:6056 length:1239 start_codon:yes stop_codon:yes gene_type:complete
MDAKKIWLVNQYAMPPIHERRFQTLKRAQYLSELGHHVTIISGSFLHNTDINLITNGDRYIEEEYNGMRFIHIKTNSYSTNGFRRVLNHLVFPVRFFSLFRKFEKPDIICHLATVPFGNIIYFIAKRLKAKFIVDVVDLWPESFVTMGVVSKENPLLKLAYWGERWLYERSDKLVFSMEGGKDYIKEKGWDLDSGGSIDLNDVHYINNGVDIEEFDRFKGMFSLQDADLENDQNFNVVYIGSIRLANNIKKLVEAAEVLRDVRHVKFLIYGDGEDREPLEKYCKEKGLENIIFKQRWVESKYVPYILSRSSLNILNYFPNPIFRFGGSQSKSFQYMASGKPILCNLTMGYCPITKHNAGIAREFNDAFEYAEAILHFVNLSAPNYEELCRNSRKLANNYDYRYLTGIFNSIL